MRAISESPSSANVVKFPHSRSKNGTPEDRDTKGPASTQPVTPGEAPTTEQSTEYQFPVSAIDRLPFVVARQNYWNDEPTDDDCADYDRGKKFAAMTIAAMRDDFTRFDGHGLARAISARRFELILGAMVHDGIRRAKKGGRGSRKPLTSTMDGFLSDLCRAIYDALAA